MTDPPISYSITLKLLTPLTSGIIYNKNLHIGKGICEPYTGNMYHRGDTTGTSADACGSVWLNTLLEQHSV